MNTCHQKLLSNVAYTQHM